MTRSMRRAGMVALVAALGGCAGASMGRPDTSGRSVMAEESGYGGGTTPAPMEPMAGGEADSEMAPPALTTPGAPLGQTTVTVQVVPVPVPQPQHVPQARILTAGSVADHDRRGNFLEFMQRHPYEGSRLQLDMTRRVRFRVTDQYGRPAPDARIVIQAGGAIVEGRTHGDGIWDFYPGVSCACSGQMRARIQLDQLATDTVLEVPSYGDGQDVMVRFGGIVTQPAPVLDLAFLIDVTGSMGDELRYVNAEVADIVQRVRAEVPEVGVRVAAVFYRDRVDSQPIQMINFTQDVNGFAAAMQQVYASGGGDYPEDVNAGLDAAFHRLSWSTGPATRVMVIIGDAPPQPYATNFTYRQAMAEAASRGIRILPVAASGANREVEYLWRAMGAFTSSPYVYLSDDSGVGNPHLEADTDRVAIEYFNDLLSRVLVSDLRGEGMHEPGPFGPDQQQQ